MSVYANGREVSGKATPNKTIAAFPDVCLSPPSPPAGPVPIPYPLFGTASDTSDGTGSVKINGKEVGKKNGSNYNKVNGNQPATSSFGAGVVSHKIQGPLEFAAYSLDVLFERGGAERFLDVTTQNHSNPPNSSAGWSTATAALGLAEGEAKCKQLSVANEEVRTDAGGAVKDKAWLDGLGRGAEGGFLTKMDFQKIRTGGSATVTHGVFTPAGGSPRVVRACSNKRAVAYYNGMAEGAPRSQAQSAACDGDFAYEDPAGTDFPQSHTESRILEDLFKNGPDPRGGTLLLSIDWATAEPPNTKSDACDWCKDLICAAAECMTIEICHGTPKKPKNAAELYCPRS